MVEWTRRPRVGFANSSPGASGVIARPNYVGPSGNGLVEWMNAGAKNPAGSGDLENDSFRLQKAVPRTKEKRRSGAPRGERPSHGRALQSATYSVASFGAPLSLTFWCGSFPLVRE